MQYISMNFPEINAKMPYLRAGAINDAPQYPDSGWNAQRFLGRKQRVFATGTGDKTGKKRGKTA